MYIPPVFELGVIGVLDTNIANQERILVRPAQTVDLTEFGILLGYRRADGSVVPVPDSFFWFGNVVVSPPSWLIIHTGRGTYQKAIDPNRNEEVHHFFWGRWFTIFSDPALLPIVFRIGSLVFGPQLHPNPEPLRLK